MKLEHLISCWGPGARGEVCQKNVIFLSWGKKSMTTQNCLIHSQKCCCHIAPAPVYVLRHHEPRYRGYKFVEPWLLTSYMLGGLLFSWCFLAFGNFIEVFAGNQSLKTPPPIPPQKSMGENECWSFPPFKIKSESHLLVLQQLCRPSFRERVCESSEGVKTPRERVDLWGGPA